jgi:hypothetical protein
VPNGDTQFPPLPDFQPPIVSATQAYPHDSSEEIQRNLLALAVQQAQIQTRIRTLRHAISALVQAFGPTILCGDYPVICERLRPITSAHPPMMDVCRMILTGSRQWLTLSQILDAVRIKYPSTMGRFLKPGTALSNALRALHRHGVVETKLKSGVREWRFASEQSG